jgi:hypothetical protein
MMQREQNTGKPGYPKEDRLEAEEPAGAQSIEGRKTANEDSAIGGSPERSLLDAILSVDICSKRKSG